MDKYEEELLKKIDSKKELTESEIREILGCEIESEYGDNRRWSRSVTTISQIGDRYFSTDWEEGLTEYQQNEYYEQPVEVEKVTYEKTIIVTEWKEIKKDIESEDK